MIRIALLAALAAMPVAPVDARPGRTSDGMLRGRIAGPPQSCIARFRTSTDFRLFDDHVLIFDGPGGVVYANRPPDCPFLDTRAAIVSRTPTTTVCRAEIIDVVEVPSGISRGPCTLGDFVPYRRPAAR